MSSYKEVKMGDFQMLRSDDPEDELLTFAVAGCTALALFLPDKTFAVLAHIQPGLGFVATSDKIATHLRELSVDPNKQRIFYEIILGPFLKKQEKPFTKYKYGLDRDYEFEYDPTRVREVFTSAVNWPSHLVSNQISPNDTWYDVMITKSGILSIIGNRSYCRPLRFTE